MKDSFVGEIIVSVVLMGFLAFLFNPSHLYMTMPAQMMTSVALIVIFAIFAVFIWRERGRDERENLHIFIAGRAAFLTGAAALLVGIIVQSFNHNVDPWLLGTLVLMILAKIFGIIYTRTRR